MEPMGRDNRANRYTPETRERAVRMVLENESNYSDRSTAIRAIAPKIGVAGSRCADGWRNPRLTAAGAMALAATSALIKELEREVRELRQANEILRKASAYFAQAELDRPLKR
jgi:transposase